MTSGSRARVKAEQVLEPLILAGPGPVTLTLDSALVVPWARRPQEAAKGPASSANGAIRGGGKNQVKVCWLYSAENPRHGPSTLCS